MPSQRVLLRFAPQRSPNQYMAVSSCLQLRQCRAGAGAVYPARARAGTHAGSAGAAPSPPAVVHGVRARYGSTGRCVTKDTVSLCHFVHANLCTVCSSALPLTPLYCLLTSPPASSLPVVPLLLDEIRHTHSPCVIDINRSGTTCWTSTAVCTASTNSR